jgi:hypothetical protein
MGALTQAPKHSTSESVNNLSFVVSPTPMPRVALQAATISSDPLSQQGVVVHTFKMENTTICLISHFISEPFFMLDA